MVTRACISINNRCNLNYVTCPHCGEENIQKGYGEDDD